MSYLLRLFWLVLVVAAVGTELKAKDLEVGIETNWCSSNNLRDGESCKVEFAVTANEIETIRVYLSPYKDHSQLVLRRIVKKPFKTIFKFKGSGELRLILIATDKTGKILGIKEELIDIERKGGWVLGDQDKRSVWEFPAPEFYYYNNNPFSTRSSKDYREDETYDSEYYAPDTLNYSVLPPPGYDENNFDPSYYPPIDYEEEYNGDY